MTESISPKPLPYRSVSPNPHRIVDQSNEKSQLRKLNDQFLSYIERVRIFETFNNCLTIHCEEIRTAQERTKAKLDALQQEFDEYQQEKFQREKKDLQLEYENIHENEKQIEHLKNKQNFFQNEHDQYRKQVIDLQKQSIELQAKTDELRFEYENLNDDNHHYRKHISYYQSLKSSILDEITRQRDIHQRLQIEVEDLKMQKQITTQAHEADTQAIEIHNDNILYDLTTNFRFDGNGKNMLTQMLNEIRQEYKVKDNDMREELHRKYLYEYNQHFKKQIDHNILETNREDIERKHLSSELNSLNDNRLLLRQKLTLIQEHYKQLDNNFQREVQRKKDMEEKYNHQIKDLRSSVNEYENLLNNNSLVHRTNVEDEVDKYRQLLEGSDRQIGLRQLLNMPNKLDRFVPIERPTTPIHKSESASTLPHLTRQNSTSENSYETALISQTSTNTTNQQYITLDSATDKVFHSDYDTDNDQSQTIQYMSGRSSRLTSETDTTPTILTPTDQESLPPLPPDELINHNNDTIVEISIDTSHTEIVIDQTLPFVPMTVVTAVEIDENKDPISNQQQSPIISTLEKREEVEKVDNEPITVPPTETVIPITIDVDSEPVKELNEEKTVSPSTPIMSADEQPKPTESPTPTTESTVVEVPISTLSTTNPLAKLMSMLPNATPFVPSSNSTTNQVSTMNNDATPFVPSQHQHGSNQQQLNNPNTGHWSGANARNSGGNNRRGQNPGGGFHHGGGGGNQRSGVGVGGNWQQSGGHHKQRRGGK